MQITTISRGSFSKGKMLAEELAANLGHTCISREDIIEAATKDGIPVGKMEEAILKPRHFNERLLSIKEHYQAFATAYLCERVLETDIVYHGRTGHLMFPGIRNILRVKVTENSEQRIASIMERMKLDRTKASKYIRDIDEDLYRYTKTLYGVDWNDYFQYDMILNFDNVTVKNAASALCSMIALPEFQTVPANARILENLLNASKARLALAKDRRTAQASFRVDCRDGVATVTYRPVDTEVAELIPEILRNVNGIKEINATMASAHILWVQEDFSNSDETYGQIVDIANRWNAAVELIQYNTDMDEEEVETIPRNSTAPVNVSKEEYNGGIEDDTLVTHRVKEMDGNLSQTHSKLARDGVAGGHLSCGGSVQRLLDTLDGNIKYNLVAVGNVFASKGHATQTRMRREFISTLTDKLHTPVVEVEELESTYMFTFNQAIKFLVFLFCAITIFTIVFTNQVSVIKFIHTEGLSNKVMAAAFVVVLVPIFAALYGTVAKILLKLIRIE